MRRAGAEADQMTEQGMKKIKGGLKSPVEKLPRNSFCRFDSRSPRNGNERE